MNRFDSLRSSWRGIAATWGGAAWLVMHQFGTPATRATARRHEIVQIEEADELRDEVESLPDGRMLTVPADCAGGRNRQDPDNAGYRMNPN